MEPSGRAPTAGLERGPRLLRAALRQAAAAVRQAAVAGRRGGQGWRLAVRAAEAARGDRAGTLRVLAVGSWEFPVYSQSFVYQELAGMAAAAFQVRLVHARQLPRRYLPAHQDILWRRRCRLPPDPAAAAAARARYLRLAPERVAALDHRVARAAGCPLADLREHPDYLRGFAFTRLAEAFRPHWLHSYFFYEGSLQALVAAELLGIPRGVTCYADHQLADYPLKLVPLHLERARLVVATSERIRDELAAIAPGADRSRLLVKPNGIAVAAFPQVARAEPAHGEPFRLLAVSRLDPKKGLLDLLAAAARLRAEGWPVVARVLGGADPTPAGVAHERELRGHIAQLGAGAWVRLEGPRTQPEVLRALHESHLFVAPAVETPEGDKDGIPTALLEAMATALPAVATRAGSIPEAITPGVDGELVPPGVPAALAAAIAALLADPGRRRRLGAAAAASVRRRFDASRCDAPLHQRIRELALPTSGESDRLHGADPRA